MNADNDSDDGSSTMLPDESSIIENWSFTVSAAPSRAALSPPPRQRQSFKPTSSPPDEQPGDGMSQSPLPPPPPRAGRNDKSVTFDDSITLCSPHLAQNAHYSANSIRSPAPAHARRSADESLCSDISLMYDDNTDHGHERRRSSRSGHLRRSSPLCQPLSTSMDEMSPSLYSSSTPLTPPIRRERPWPKRDEYEINHQANVRAAISKFDLLHPGKLRNYRTMTPDQKAREREHVLALLSRIHNRSNNYDGGGGSMSSQKNIHPMNIMRSAHAGGDPAHTVAALDDTRRSPSMRSQDRLVDQAPSPCFLPPLAAAYLAAADAASPPLPPSSSLRESENAGDDDYDIASPTLSPPARGVDKSEILLSPEGGTTTNEDENDQVASQKNDGNMKKDDEDSDVSMNFPIDNDAYHDDYQQDAHGDFRDQDSTSSIELARGARQHEDHDSIGERSYATPEDQIQKPICSKRQATTSGKRGSNSQRSRNNDHAPIDIMSSRLDRMSISPRQSSPPPNLFPTSQSPISPRLTCSPANDEEDSDNGYRHEEQRISWGRDNDDPKQQSTTSTEDSLMSRSPRSGMKSYRSRREKRRVPREVPTNVSLVDGATFHLDKLPVKRTEQLERSHTGRQKQARPGATALQRRRLVSFPDPLVRYGSRTRNALKEIYRWIHGAEFEFGDGKSTIPAVGVFFSLSYQQVMDVSLKLLLDDLSSNKKQSRLTDPPSSSTMKGYTIVVTRTKEDCSLWESALRDGTGCSVLNHATLPLSERIRTSTAEKACLHDVVLTTFDAMKSPDVAIPITQKGYVILSNAPKEGGWHSSRTGSQLVGGVTPQKTKQFSVLHRVHYRRIILVDTLGRKCFLAKEGTARNSAVIALSGDSRLAFFSESEADGSSALVALRKSDKRAFKSVSAALHLSEYDGTMNGDDVEDSSDDEDDDRSRGLKESTLEAIALDLKDLL